MKLITAPQKSSFSKKSLFLAGGISNCPIWQNEAISILKDTSLTIFNPRREGVLPPSLEKEQIVWEHNALHEVAAVSFWFPKETLCPITLFELGVHANRNVKLFVGVEPGYLRELNVKTQLKLIHPDLVIHDNLNSLFNEVKTWDKSLK